MTLMMPISKWRRLFRGPLHLGFGFGKNVDEAEAAARFRFLLACASKHWLKVRGKIGNPRRRKRRHGFTRRCRKMTDEVAE